MGEIYRYPRLLARALRLSSAPKASPFFKWGGFSYNSMIIINKFKKGFATQISKKTFSHSTKYLLEYAVLRSDYANIRISL